MRYQILLVLVITVAVLSIIASPNAHAQGASQTLTRLDAIIKEMQALRAEFESLSSTLAVKPQGAVLGASSKTFFTQSLEVGVTNSDIKKIQKLLATDKEIYPYGVSSGFYGPKTEEAIKNFQKRFSLDPVGVVGPATKSLFELFFSAYPDDVYPADVLKKKPTVLGASTSNVPPTTPTPAPVSNTNAGTPTSILAVHDGDGAKVTFKYTGGDKKTEYITGDTKIKVIDAIALQKSISKAKILSIIEFTTAKNDDDEDEDEDEDDFDVKVKIDNDEVTVTFTYDGDDYKVKVDSTDEDDVLDEVADELDEDEVDDIDEDLKDAIEDALEDALEDEDEDKDGDGDEIESITANVANGKAQIEVEYGDGDEEEFEVEETLEDSIIEEVADELNIDEDEVEDVIEFKYEDIDEIRVEIRDNGTALAFVEFEDGTIKRVRVDSDDEDEIIQELADILDEDEEDIEDWVEFE